MVVKILNQLLKQQALEALHERSLFYFYYYYFFKASHTMQHLNYKWHCIVVRSDQTQNLRSCTEVVKRKTKNLCFAMTILFFGFEQYWQLVV